MEDRKKRVAYMYNPDIGNYSYGDKHFMDPKRISMTHSLITGFGVYKKLDVYTSREATQEEITQFHAKDYIEYISNYVAPSKKKIMESLGIVQDTEKRINKKKHEKYGIGFDMQEDCPGFEGLWTFSQLSTGGSIDAAHLIINNDADIAINWGGGLHHARKCGAYGFCYVNDIVICILELLKVYPRVLYVDIDVHHGDGVEEAFLTTNRVMTVSFHEFGDSFFPGTGSLDQIGEGEGRYHKLNIPLKRFINDQMFEDLFQTVMSKTIESFRPDAIVFQAGADSLAHDRIGHFNLTIKGHAKCLEFITSQGIPVVLVGGGGYTIRNVAKCWCYETGKLVGEDLNGQVPDNDEFVELYQGELNLHFKETQETNQNTAKYIDLLKTTTLQYLKNVEARPSVQFHDVPNTFLCETEENNYHQDDQNNMPNTNYFYQFDQHDDEKIDIENFLLKENLLGNNQNENLEARRRGIKKLQKARNNLL